MEGCGCGAGLIPRPGTNLNAEYHMQTRPGNETGVQGEGEGKY